MKRISNSPAIMAEVTLWMESLRQKGRSPSTMATYAAALLNLGRFLTQRGKTTAVSVSAEDLMAWQQSLVAAKLRPSSVDNFTRSVRGFFAWSAQIGRLFADPACNLSPPKFQRLLGVCPTEGDMRRWLDGMTGDRPVAIRDRTLVEVAYSTGTRIEELSQLETGSLDLVNRLVRVVGKGAKVRMVPLTTPALQSLEIYLAQSRPVLLRGRTDVNGLWIGSRGGRPLTSQALATVIVRSAAKAGLHLTAHAIRRAFATHLLRNGAHIADIKDLIGHSGYRRLYHYLRLSPMEVVDTHSKSKPGRR